MLQRRHITLTERKSHREDVTERILEKMLRPDDKENVTEGMSQNNVTESKHARDKCHRVNAKDIVLVLSVLSTMLTRFTTYPWCSCALTKY